jgi:hypothetical protein
VGNAGRLRISNGASDYSLIGTIDTEGATNTRIILSGNTRGSGLAGDIQYYATTAIGEHLFYVNENNILTLSSTTLTTSSNIDCGGGIAIAGSTGFFNTTNVNPVNLENTYINFKSAGGTGDWCYLRQIGTPENYKLALDFHDDIDARFCIRSITSTSNTDVINEVFTVDNGTITSSSINLTTSTSGNNVVFIKSTNANANNCIVILNNINITAHIGVGGNTFGGNYQNNLFFECGTGSIIFNSGNTGTSGVPRMIINTSGNVGIGTTNPSQILQVGNAGRLRISNGASDYSLIGTIDTDDNATNTKIFFNGNSYNGAGARGFIQYYATTTNGGHAFYTENTEKMRLRSDGILNLNGNLLIAQSGSLPAEIRLNLENTYNIAIAGVQGQFAAKAQTNDMIIRTNERLLLLSGSGEAGLVIDKNNNVNVSNINVSNVINFQNTGLLVALPAKGVEINASIGNRIILFPGTANSHAYALGISNSTLWYSVPNTASHKFYINGTAYLTVNNTGATVNGSLNATSLQESGKNISTIYDKITDRQLEINNLANTYVSSNQLYNYTYTYSSAQVYPPKLYNSASIETITTYLSQSVYYQVMQLDATGITYGSGTYEIYSSSSYDSVNTHNKVLLFNNTDEQLTAAWKNNNYDTVNGTYIISNGKNINGYYGDWIIIKLPVSIILTSFKFYPTFILGTEARSPGEWKCYGSVDGITYTEITEGASTSRLVSSDYTTNGFYEKTLSTFNTPYQYIGWVINKLVATSGQTFLHFSELKIYGKQVQPLLINDKYLSSNILPNIQKKTGFQITCSTPITLNGTTYYKYDINLTKYTQNSSLYRIFNINCFIASGYFNLLSNNLPRVFNYNVYMSNKTAAGDGPAGINICATGTPENFNLDKIPPNYLFLLRTNDYNFLSIVSTQLGAIVNCIIMDNLN